jgi:hypothetical protein
VRVANENDYADLWLETTIPTEAIPGEKRLRTLNVGRVRALLDNGEYFEGNLYAVGQNRIWIQMDLGRISFDAAIVKELTPNGGAISSQMAQAKAAAALAALPHVEVSIPGGTLSGRLIGQSDGFVTLISDSGMRCTVESDDVHPVTKNNSRVVGTVEGAVFVWPPPKSGPPKGSTKPAPKPASKTTPRPSSASRERHRGRKLSKQPPSGSTLPLR